MSKIEEALLLAVDLRPYYARAISALTPVAHEHVSTMGVDSSWRLYHSREWVESTPLKQLAAVIAGHEVEHLLRDHAGRRCERHPAAWNLAGDLEINDDCDLELPPDGCFPSAFGMPDQLMAEEYFERLPRPEAAPCCGSGAGNPLPGELEPSGLAVDAAARDALVAAVRADVLHHSASAPGSIPAAVLMWANDKPAPVRLPWPRLLAATLRGEFAGRGSSDYSWRKPSRRQSLVIRPSLVAFRPSVVLIVDTSGSMGGTGGKVLGIIREVVSRSGASLVAVIECDAAAKRKRRAKNWNGGGGTDLRAAFALASTIKRSATIVVTDCETPWPDAAVPNTVAVSTTAHSAPPWAKTIRV
jgi:predicted metal-dependent peptidase